MKEFNDSFTAPVHENINTYIRSEKDLRVDTLYEIVETLEYRVVELESKIKRLEGIAPLGTY